MNTSHSVIDNPEPVRRVKPPIEIMNNTNINELKQVDFQYQGDAAFTLNNVSFKIPKNQWTSIVGHNGSGKSTFLKILSGKMEANSGNIYLEPGKRLSVLEQNHNSHDQYSIIDTVCVPT